MPCHENFRRHLAEHLGPRAALPSSCLFPRLLESRDQPLAIRLQVLHERRRNGAGERLLGRGRHVAGRPELADFVLDLHQDDRVLPIALPQEAHERRERPGVGITTGGAEWRYVAAVLSRLELSARKTLQVLFHPRRDVAGVTVFPCSEPEEDQAQTVPASPAEQTFHEGEVKASFLRLHKFPVDGRQDGVAVQPRQPFPDGLHELQAGRVGVLDLRAQNDERLVVHHQYGSSLNPVEAGQRFVGRGMLRHVYSSGCHCAAR